MKNIVKKTICAALSAVTLSFCVSVPTSFTNTSCGNHFVNAIEANAAFQPYNGKVVTKGSDLNVRSGPGTNYKVLYSVPNGTPVAILEEKNGWGRVSDANGGQWVSLNYIQRITAAEALSISNQNSAPTKTASNAASSRPKTASSSSSSKKKQETHAYKVKESFAYPVAMSLYSIKTGTANDNKVTTGHYVLNYNVYRGTILELDSNGLCVSGFDCVTKRDYKGWDFSYFIGWELTRIY